MRTNPRHSAWFAMSLIVPLLLMGAAWKWLILPGLAMTSRSQQVHDQLKSNVYERSWLDSAQSQLEEKLGETESNLKYGLGRLLPERPFQQTLDSLRHLAGQSGIEILETQVATTKDKGLRTILLKVRARGQYASFWKWQKAMESHQPWWTVQELLLKTVGESNLVLDGSLVLAATGQEEVLP